jgi:hypothetical protein
MEDAGGTVIHAHGQRDLDLVHGPSEKLMGGVIQPQGRRRFIQLLLGDLERVEALFHG